MTIIICWYNIARENNNQYTQADRGTSSSCVVNNNPGGQGGGGEETIKLQDVGDISLQSQNPQQLAPRDTEEEGTVSEKLERQSSPKVSRDARKGLDVPGNKSSSHKGTGESKELVVPGDGSGMDGPVEPTSEEPLGPSK